MKRPQDAMKAAYTLQGFATVYYTVFAVVMYVYLGPGVASPAFSSRPVKWQKVTYGIALPNFQIAGSLYAHTSAKLFFIRLFRNSIHLHENTVIGWATWTGLAPCFKWSSIRPSGRSSDLPLPCRYRCISLRIVVVSCPVP